MPHHVVIVGGGFAGLNAARALGDQRDVKVTLLDRRNHHIFQPLLYQVATGGLSPGEIANPIRGILRHQKNVEVLLAEVVNFDVTGKKVILADGEVPYDTLILAAGSQTSYFGNDAWAAFAPGLKTVEEATEIRARIFWAFEQAERESDPAMRAVWLTFVIVGGGPTGVELAGALGEIARDTLRGDFRRIHPEEARIILIDGNDRVLTAFPKELSQRAEEDLIRLGVRFRNNLRVTGATSDGVSVKHPDGHMETIPTHTILWAAGVKASPLGVVLAAQTGAETDRGGRIKTQADCTIAGHPEIFVVGDLGAFTDAAGKQLPGVAQVAMQQGNYVAKWILKRLRGHQGELPRFVYWDKGNMATIGRASAVADLGKIRFGGIIAWFLWLGIHLLYLVEFQNRLVVAVKWGFQYLSFNRGARLITGQRRPNAAPMKMETPMKMDTP